MDYIMGKNTVIEALQVGRDMNKIWIAEGSHQEKIVKLARQAGVIVQVIPKQKIDQMVTGNHQGVVASVAAYQYFELEELFKRATDRNEQPFFLVLDELEDPHNLGSIMRTADAVGAHGIIIPKRRAVGLTETVAKTSTGAIEHIPVVRVANIARTLDELKKKGLWIVGSDASSKDDYRSLDGTMPLALVIGSEGKGIGRLVLEHCDFLIHLPMIGHVTSLNASVAASLFMYEVFRKRHPLEG